MVLLFLFQNCFVFSRLSFGRCESFSTELKARCIDDTCLDKDLSLSTLFRWISMPCSLYTVTTIPTHSHSHSLLENQQKRRR